jgi:integrase
MPHLTDTMIRKLPAPPSGNHIIRDDRIRGFGIRITANDARAFVLNYTIAGRERRLTIGSFPAWSTLAALEEAKRLKREIDRGIDPLRERNEERSAPTVRRLAGRFVDEYAPTKKPSYLKNNKQILDRWILPTLGNHRVAELHSADVDALFGKITKAGSPVMANRAVSCLSKLCSLAVRWGMRADNPCRNAIDRNREFLRKVSLKPDQLIALTTALRGLRSQAAADCIRLILLTGCRRGEAMAVRADQIDFEKRIWSKPASSTKQSRPHEVPLSAPTLELLARLDRDATGPFLFPGRDGTGHLVDIKSSWRSLCKAAGLTGIRLHDLRHVFASIAVSRGATLPLIGALLGHSNPATTARYAHLYDDPQRALAESVAAVITDNSGGDIVPLRRR